MEGKLPLVHHPEKGAGFVMLLRKHPQSTKNEDVAYMKRLGYVEGRGRSIKEARNDFLLKNADKFVSVTARTINDD